MTYRLECKNICKSYTDSKFRLRDISIGAQQGDIIGLIGRNGAGKTTLLNALSGIYPADSGAIFYDGKRVDSEFFEKRLGYLPDSLNLYDYLSITENLNFVIEVRGLKNKGDEIEHWLEELELTNYRDVTLQNLSKGMRQKFNFIVSILHDPQILLLDEPFNGLDPKQIMVFQDIIKRIADKGVIVILSSHILSFITELCNKTILIEDGKIVKKLMDMTTVSKQYLESLFENETLSLEKE